MKSLSVVQLNQQLAEIECVCPAVYRIGYHEDHRVDIAGVLRAVSLDADNRVMLNGRYVDAICDYRTQGPRGRRGEVVFELEGDR